MSRKTPRFDEETLQRKLTDAMTPGLGVEFDPEEADGAGAFVEDALSEAEALESDCDSVEEQP